LVESGPVTPTELAARTGYVERYLAEWLAQQAAAGFVQHDPATHRFVLPPEHAMVLARDDSPASLAGAFEALTGWHFGIDRVAEDFRSGRGIGWDANDERVARGVSRFFGADYRAHLVQDWVPALGLTAALRQGARIADIGCGYGVTTILMAQAFPRSTFLGIDASERSIQHARKSAAEAGVTDRLRFEVGDAGGFDGGPYDIIWFFDSLHDLGDPVAAASQARSQLSGQGTVALVEPFAHDEFSDNLSDNPGAGMTYAASTLLCVPHALSESGVMALGAQAGGRRLADTLRAAGLAHTEQVAHTAMHAVYAARP
jgi:SAM-dependent methyltransferase